MENSTRVAEVIWFNKKYLLFFKTSVIGFRYNDDSFVTIDEVGTVKEVKESELTNITRRHYVRTNRVGITMGKRFLSKVLEGNRAWRQEELIKTYLNEIKHNRR